jgi:hypothetical protein
MYPSFLMKQNESILLQQQNPWAKNKIGQRRQSQRKLGKEDKVNENPRYKYANYRRTVFTCVTIEVKPNKTTILKCPC